MNFAIHLLHSVSALLAEAAEETVKKAAEVAETAADVAAQAAEAVPTFGPYDMLGTAIGIGVACLSAAWGIGRIASTAVESIARQPEASADIRGAMILTAAFIEGVCLFAVTVALIKGGIGL